MNEAGAGTPIAVFLAKLQTLAGGSHRDTIQREAQQKLRCAQEILENRGLPKNMQLTDSMLNRAYKEKPIVQWQASSGQSSTPAGSGASSSAAVTSHQARSHLIECWTRSEAASGERTTHRWYRCSSESD